ALRSARSTHRTSSSISFNKATTGAVSMRTFRRFRSIPEACSSDRSPVAGDFKLLEHEPVYSVPSKLSSETSEQAASKLTTRSSVCPTEQLSLVSRVPVEWIDRFLH